MRIHGTLIKWNDGKGFGFVALPQTQDEVFVHISAFPRDGVRPQVGETISFEVRTGPDGRTRAEAVERAAIRKTLPKPRITESKHQRTSIGAVLALVAVAALGFVGYSAYTARASNEAIFSVSPEVEATGQRFVCDGRTHCSQMTSCAEATYFLKHCPGTQMDGNGDGEPCEQQWCN
jgi:cold shock CspA family protein